MIDQRIAAKISTSDIIRIHGTFKPKYNFLRVPLLANSRLSASQELIFPRPSTTRKSVLTQVPMISIVDDDESVREATKGLVRSLGYAAATFGSAEEFLSSDQRYDTSCVITDVQMPGLSGVEMQRRLIAEGHTLPMIFVTAFPEDHGQSMTLGNQSPLHFNSAQAGHLHV